MEKNKDNRLVIIVKIEKYIEYMLTILLKLPRTEKFSIGTEMELMLNLTFIVMLTIGKGHIKNKQNNIRSLVA